MAEVVAEVVGVVILVIVASAVMLVMREGARGEEATLPSNAGAASDIQAVMLSRQKRSKASCDGFIDDSFCMVSIPTLPGRVVPAARSWKDTAREWYGSSGSHRHMQRTKASPIFVAHRKRRPAAVAARDFPDRGLMAPTFSLSVAAAEAGEPFLLLFAALRPDLGAGDHMLRTAFIMGAWWGMAALVE